MSDSKNIEKYDEALTSILVNEKSIIGFLSTIFSFLARKTDFYYVPKGPYENMGFPEGVAEELVVKMLRKCDPKTWDLSDKSSGQSANDVNNEIMCSTVAQEVEVVAEEDNEELETENQNTEADSATTEVKEQKTEQPTEQTDKEKNPEDYEPPVIPVQKNSEAYNGAERDKYCWSQSITELDVTIKLPPDVKSSKDLKVTINNGDISVARRNGDIIIKDILPYKIKAIDSFWSISEGKLLMHLEKVQERWWNKFLNEEEAIDLSKIDCSRPLNDLPEDHVAKVHELQWNQRQKMQGLPTSDEIRNMEILKKAWNAAGSPFKGQEFDPSVLQQSSNIPFPQ